jgi:hypothetical protein
VVLLFGIASFVHEIAVGIGWEARLPIKIGIYHLSCIWKAELSFPPRRRLEPYAELNYAGYATGNRGIDALGLV